jgi:hypothetical protein
MMQEIDDLLGNNSTTHLDMNNTTHLNTNNTTRMDEWSSETELVEFFPGYDDNNFIEMSYSPENINIIDDNYLDNVDLNPSDFIDDELADIYLSDDNNNLKEVSSSPENNSNSRKSNQGILTPIDELEFIDEDTPTQTSPQTPHEYVSDLSMVMPPGTATGKTKQTRMGGPDALGPVSDMSMVMPPGTATGKTKRGQLNGGEKKQRKLVKNTVAGFNSIGRKVYRGGGGALAIGNHRSCLPDALWMLLKENLDIDVSIDHVRNILSASGDTPFTSAQNYVSQHGQQLNRVSPQFLSKKGGPELALLNAKGLYIIQLRIPKDDSAHDMHCIAYDGAKLRDNDRYSKVKVLEAIDRKSTENARDVFRSLINTKVVFIQNIYQLVPM